MSTFSVSDLFADTMAKSIAGVQGNTGQGALGEWPADGDHQCVITGITAKPTEFKAANNVKLPGVTVQFEFETVNVAADRKEPNKFFGAPFTFPKDKTQVTVETNLTRIRIEEERLQGHLSIVNGSPTTDIRVGLQQAMEKTAKSRVEVMVRCTSRKGNNNNTYRTEFLTENLSRA